MAHYDVGQEYRTTRRMRWTHRKTFIAVMTVGISAWAGLISLAKYVVT